jgi:hypothetical protein
VELCSHKQTIQSLHVLTRFFLIIAVFLSYGLADAGTTGGAKNPLSSSSSPPRIFKIAEELPNFLIRLQIKELPNNRKIIKELLVTKVGEPNWAESLSVNDMEPIKKDKDFFIGTADINSDGFNDLYLVTNNGVANAYADYWIYDPVGKDFIYVGNFPVLSIDTPKRLLSSYERGGNGGMIYESKRYQFIDGKLEIIEVEKQEASQAYGIYLKQIFRRKGGRLILINSQNVTVTD